MDPMTWSTAETSNPDMEERSSKPDMECMEEDETKVSFRTKVSFSELDEDLSWLGLGSGLGLGLGLYRVRVRVRVRARARARVRARVMVRAP